MFCHIFSCCSQADSASSFLWQGWMGIELVLISWYLSGNREFVKFFLAVRGAEAFSPSPLNSLFNLNSLLEWQGIKMSGKLKPYIKHLCVAEVWQCRQKRWILYNLCLLERIKGKFYRLDLWSQRNSLSFVWVAWQNWVHWILFHLVFNKQKYPHVEGGDSVKYEGNLQIFQIQVLFLRAGFHSSCWSHFRNLSFIATLPLTSW